MSRKHVPHNQKGTVILILKVIFGVLEANSLDLLKLYIQTQLLTKSLFTGNFARKVEDL